MSEGYRRQVGPYSATMLIASSMVGSGVFLVAADIVRTGRSAGFLMAAWALVALLTVAAALSYGELAAVFVSRWKNPDLPRPYKVFGYPFLPAFSILAGLAILGTLLRFKPAFTWPGLVIVALAVPV